MENENSRLDCIRVSEQFPDMSNDLESRLKTLSGFWKLLSGMLIICPLQYAICDYRICLNCEWFFPLKNEKDEHLLRFQYAHKISALWAHRDNVYYLVHVLSDYNLEEAVQMLSVKHLKTNYPPLQCQMYYWNSYNKWTQLVKNPK